VKTPRPVMVTDSTMYDTVEGLRLVPDCFARVDAMANHQDQSFRVVQLSAVEAPACLTSLDAWSNAFSVRTRIAGCERLTKSGQEELEFPTASCADGDSLTTEYRARSPDATTVDNEYWMWWTNTDAYPSDWGCAAVGTLGETLRDGAVGWTSFRNSALETVGQTLMHETAHVRDADHLAVATGHRCRVSGILEFVVTAPRSWAAPPIATCARTASRSRNPRRRAHAT